MSLVSVGGESSASACNREPVYLWRVEMLVVPRNSAPLIDGRLARFGFGWLTEGDMFALRSRASVLADVHTASGVTVIPIWHPIPFITDRTRSEFTTDVAALNLASSGSVLIGVSFAMI